jgi:hypothetical protein
MKQLTRFQQVLIKEYNRTRKHLRTQLKQPTAPEDVRTIIKNELKKLTERQALIIARYIYKAYKGGTAEANKELKGIEIKAAAPIPDIGNVGIGLDTVSKEQMNRIFHRNLGAIGDYNINLSKELQHQYNLLLSDNKLLKSLNTHGWTPWLEGEWQKRGIAPEIIKLVKGQKTSAQMVSILEMQGIRGGKHPNEVAKLLVPHINRFFTSEGVKIDNIGKTVKRLAVDANGNFEWQMHKITKAYKATPRTYSRMLARNTLREARMDAYYESLKKSKLVDHYISVSHLDSNTCAHCAMMHGQIVTKGAGPQYHSNCGCDLAPMWKKDSPLAFQNKPDAFYEKQRNTHFLRMKDLKVYNAKMPRGMKLKYATQLPEDAITHVMPGKIKMRAIQHEMLGKPKQIAPAGERAYTAKKAEVTIQRAFEDNLKKQPWGMTDNEWRAEAKTLYAKTAKDGNEHLRLYSGTVTEHTGTKTAVQYYPPIHTFYGLHTHPNWDSPLSGEDVYNLLSDKFQQLTGASSDKSIYLMRKTKKAPIFRDTTRAKINFLTEFKRFHKDVVNKAFLTQGSIDSTQCLTEVNIEIAKRYGLEYKIILR